MKIVKGCTMEGCYWVPQYSRNTSCCFEILCCQRPYHFAFINKEDANLKEDASLVKVYLSKDKEVSEEVDPDKVYALNQKMYEVDCYQFPVYSVLETVFSTKDAALAYVADNPDDEYEKDEDGTLVYCLEVC